MEKSNKSSSKKYKPSLIKAIVRAFWLRFFMYQQINIWGELLIRLAQPFLVGYLVRYLTQADVRFKLQQVQFSHHSNESSTGLNDTDRDPEPLIYGREYVSHEQAIYYAAALIVTSFLFAFSRHPAFVLCLRVASNVRTALTVMIYRKILRLSKSSFEQTDIGQILNILANDLNRFEDVGWQLPYLLIGPTMSIVVIYISYTYLGIACIGGLVILILFIPFQGLMGRLFNTFRSRTTKLTDTRVRVMGEIISAMKLIKLYCWESPFAEAVSEIRE